MSKQQWTVSVERSALTIEGLEVLKNFEFEEYKENGQDRFDLEESEFFAFAEAAALEGVVLPTDGSDSWCKWV